MTALELAGLIVLAIVVLIWGGFMIWLHHWKQMQKVKKELHIEVDVGERTEGLIRDITQKNK